MPGYVRATTSSISSRSSFAFLSASINLNIYTNTRQHVEKIAGKKKQQQKCASRIEKKAWKSAGKNWKFRKRATKQCCAYRIESVGHGGERHAVQDSHNFDEIDVVVPVHVIPDSV
jgi:hypothetical protein